MSSMHDLYTKVAEDPILQQKFSLIMAEAEQAGQIDDPSGKGTDAVSRQQTEEKFLAFAREAGFEVSIAEMQAFFQGMAAQAEGQLSDAELDQVAGGKSSNGALAIVESVISFGIACALNSISEALSKLDCAAKYQ